MLHPAESEIATAPESVTGGECGVFSSRPLLIDGPALPAPTLDGEKGAYGRAFWLTYLSLTALMVAASLMYRYADFITFLGGGELELGVVVGVGMIGSLLMRLAQGIGIDRYGPRLIWLGSTVLFVIGTLGHLLVMRLGGAEIFLLQVLYRTSIAGVFGSAFTFAIQQMPVHRMTEAVGTVGTASFVGMLIGPKIGDRILGGGGSVHRADLNWMFVVAAGLGCVSFAAAWLATSRETRPRPRRHVPVVPVLRRYHPGVLLAVGVVTGIAMGMPTTFLCTFAAELNIKYLGLFFTVFALSAIVTRFATRRMAEYVGIRLSILIGLALFVAAAVSYLSVGVEWQLVFPAFLTGAGQAILYPAVVAGGSAVFPEHYRGMGTTVMLGSIDVGILVGAPLVGGIVHYAKQFGLPGYPTMFLSIAAILTIASGYYALTARESPASGRA